MVMHVLQTVGMDFDFMVGAQLDGFDVMVRITEESGIMIFEGDEYLTSAIDTRPKFHLYYPHIALISGIAWDHINVFPTFEIYVDQFTKFIELIEPGGTLIYYEGDEVLQKMVPDGGNISSIPYGLPDYTKEEGIIYLIVDEQKFPLHVFGEHNLQNIAGAMKVCEGLGISQKVFSEAISSFKGAAKRLQLLDEFDETAVYLDFAHAPSKLKATVAAVKDHFPERELVACMELHTFSSLSEGFLSQYKGAMDKVDQAKVYFSPHTLALKKLPEISIQQIREAFDHKNMNVYTDSSQMLSELLGRDWKKSNLLLMSSGNFDGLDLQDLARRILSKDGSK
jgi:UDP-N-acetylmuramate: L-alanyl-gamma-D-glutamyl-meso-diaminopimelate ligase